MTTVQQAEQAISKGDKFRLIGNTTAFRAVTIRRILGGMVEVVDGISLDGRSRTSARVVDTITLAKATGAA